MDQGMKSIGFTLSKFNPCLYYRNSIIFLVYIDDCIVFGPNDKAIDEVATDLHNNTQNFTLDDQGEVGDFLGIQIQKWNDRSIVLTQPHLIDSIIQDLHPQSGSNPKSTPSITSKLLHKDAEGLDMTPDFHYHSVIGNLIFLEKSTRRTSLSVCTSALGSPNTQNDATLKQSNGLVSTSWALVTKASSSSPTLHGNLIVG